MAVQQDFEQTLMMSERQRCRNQAVRLNVPAGNPWQSRMKALMLASAESLPPALAALSTIAIARLARVCISRAVAWSPFSKAARSETKNPGIMLSGSAVAGLH